MEVNVSQIVSTVAASGLAAVSGYVIRLVSKINAVDKKVDILEELFNDKKRTIEIVSAGHAHHDRRLALIEQVVQDLKQVTPLLNSINLLQTKMDAVLENVTRRLELVESQAFNINHKD